MHTYIYGRSYFPCYQYTIMYLAIFPLVDIKIILIPFNFFCFYCVCFCSIDY